MGSSVGENDGFAVGLAETVEVALGVRVGLMVGDCVGLKNGENVGFDVGGFVGHSRHPAQTVNPHLMSQEAGLDKQNASQSHTQKTFQQVI